MSVKKIKAAAESAVAENINEAKTITPKKRTRKPAAKNTTAKPVEEVKVDSQPISVANEEAKTAIVVESIGEIAPAQEEVPQKETKTSLKKEYKALKKVYKKAKKTVKSFRKVPKKVSKKADSDIIYSTNLNYAEAKGSKKILKRDIKALKATIKNFKKK